MTPKKRPFSDRKSTRLNSSHLVISYAVFCLKKKKKTVRLERPISLRNQRRCTANGRDTRRSVYESTWLACRRAVEVPASGAPPEQRFLTLAHRPGPTGSREHSASSATCTIGKNSSRRNCVRGNGYCQHV